MASFGDPDLDNNVVGSPYWMAPEIIEMSAPPSAACDIWSLGSTILELTTGKPPHFDLAPMAALFRIVQDEMPRIPPGASEALRDFLLKCFNREAALRPDAVSLVNHAWLKCAPGVSTSASMDELHRHQESADTSESMSCDRQPGLKKYREMEDENIEDGFAKCESQPLGLCLSAARRQTIVCLAGSEGALHLDAGKSKFYLNEMSWDLDQRAFDFENEFVASASEETSDLISADNIVEPLVHNDIRDGEMKKREEVELILFNLTLSGCVNAPRASVTSTLSKLLQMNVRDGLCLSEFGAISVVEALRSPGCAVDALRVTRLLLSASSSAADMLVGIGIAPVLVSLLPNSHTHTSEFELLGSILNLLRLHCSGPYLRRFLFGGGIQVSIELLARPDEILSPPLDAAVLSGVEFLLHVLNSKVKSTSLGPSRAALCRTLALRGAPERLTASLEASLNKKESVCSPVGGKIICVLAILCDADAIVRETVAASRTATSLLRIIAGFPSRLSTAWNHGDDGHTEARLALRLLRVLKAVTMASAAALDSLATCGAIETMAIVLEAAQTGITHKGGSGSCRRKIPRRDELEDQLVPIIYYLCRIDHSRLAKAARCGVAMLLAACVARRRHLKQFALAILCELCYAAANDTQGSIGAELWRAGGVRLYAHLLVEVYWGVRALAALSAWLKADARVGIAMAEAECAYSIVHFFSRLDTAEFEQSLAPLLCACETSPLFTKALLGVRVKASKHVFVYDLVQKLERNTAAFIRKMLLELLRAVLKVSKMPIALLGATNLDTVLVLLLTDEIATDQVLVFDLARSILLAISDHKNDRPGSVRTGGHTHCVL